MAVKEIDDPTEKSFYPHTVPASGALPPDVNELSGKNGKRCGGDLTAISCPRCNSPRVKRSHSRGLKEQLIKITGKRVYRCIHCGWRGIMRRDATESKYKKREKYTQWQVAIVIIVTLVAVSGLLYWLSSEPTKPEIPVAVEK